MSFFSRKPNPPTSAQVSKALSGPLPLATAPPPAVQAIKTMLNNGATPAQVKAAMQQWPGASGHNNTQGQSPEDGQVPSNTRFRSFCERYIIERCRDWKEGEIDERAWATILEAKSIYNKVKEVGRTVTGDN